MAYSPPHSWWYLKKQRQRRDAAAIPSWVLPGPDGALPIDQVDYALGRGWFNGQPYPNLFAYMDAASGVFLRASDGAYFDKNGRFKTAGPNILRLTHDPVTGDPLGYLAEGQATQLLHNSRLIGASSGTPGSPPTNWGGGHTTGSTEVIAGALTGSNKIRFTTPPEGGRRTYTQTVSLDANTIYFYSAEVENVGDPINLFQILYAWGTLPAGTITTYFWDGVEVNPTSKVPPGTHLLAVKIQTAEEAGSLSFRLGVGIQSNQPNADVILDMPQLEIGERRSSYIPSDAGSTTIRMADSLTFARNSTPEFTVVVEGRAASGLQGDHVLWQWDDGTNDNRYRIMRDNTGDLHAIVSVAGSDVVNLDLGPVANSTDLKVAFSCMAGQFIASLDGGAAEIDTSYTGSLPSVTTVRHGSGAADGDEWFGTVASSRQFNAAYDAAEAEGLAA